jgi:hypothetical protein
MKKVLLIIALSLSILQIQAQNFNLTFSNLESYTRFARIKEAGLVGNNLFVIVSNHKSGGVYLLNIYDKSTLQLKSSQVFKNSKCDGPNCIDKHFDYYKTLFLKNNVVMLFQTFERSSKNLQMFAQRVDQNGKFVGKFELIDEINAKSKSNAGTFMVWPSEDSTKFMIIENPPFEKYSGEKFNFKIYDSELTNKSNFGISLPYKDKDLALIDYFIGNDSKIHLLASIELERKQQKAGEAKRFYSIFTINPEDKSVAEYKLNLPNRSIEDASLKIDNEHNKFICCGFYSDLKPRAKVGNDIDGFYYLKVDIGTKNVDAQGTKEIDKEMVAELLNKKKVKEQQGISKNFSIMEIETHKDGTSTLIAENRKDAVYTYTTCSKYGCQTYTTYYYYRDNIFLINIAADGSVNSFVDVPKSQVSTNDDGKYLSFLNFKKDDRSLFIYNENPLNLKSGIKTIKDVKTMSDISGAVAVAVEVNKNGGYSKVKLFENAYKKMALLPESGIRIGNGQYIVPTMIPPSPCGCFSMFAKAKLGIAKIEM